MNVRAWSPSWAFCGARPLIVARGSDTGLCARGRGLLEKLVRGIWMSRVTGRGPV